MRKVAFYIVFLAVLVFVAVPSGSETLDIKYRACFNDRFGYSVEFPDIFHTSREPDNGDGIEFKSKDGKYSLAIWGAYNVLEDDGHSARKAKRQGSPT